jgi:hypothetical protein
MFECLHLWERWSINENISLRYPEKGFSLVPNPYVHQGHMA